MGALAAFALAGPSLMAGPILETVVALRDPGRTPTAGLVQDAAGNFYGTTQQGGPGGGTIFRLNTAGERTTLVDFVSTPYGAPGKGATPDARLVFGPDGNLYGTTRAGGASNRGTVFRLTPVGELVILAEFSAAGANRGAYPAAALTPAPDGGFYGTTAGDGGFTSLGTVFRMSSSGVLTVLVDFTENGPVNRGARPLGALTWDDTGNLIGTTAAGGSSGNGTIYRMSPDGILVTLLDFTGDSGPNRGTAPSGALVRGNDGSYYGTTRGSYPRMGTVFRFTPGGELVTLVEFTGWVGPNLGSKPLAGLTLGADNSFYGTTSEGGLYNDGTVFRVTPGGVFSTLLDFGFAYPSKGRNPSSELILGADGALYGTAANGGIEGNGTVFRLPPGGNLSVLSDFAADGTELTGRNVPQAPVQAADGNFYGTTSDGGAGGYGTIYRLTPGGTHSVLLSFTGTSGPNKGDDPRSALIIGRDGNFYGTTFSGGANNGGTVYRVTLAGMLTTLFEFSYGSPSGYLPIGGLIEASDGSLFGTTALGGANNCGTVYRITPAGVLSTLLAFTGNTGENKGNNSWGSLAAGDDADFYGTTREGGASGLGTVFRVTAAGALTTLVEFGGANAGAYPVATLTRGRDGNYYGTTSRGGANGFGTAFRMTPAGALTTLVSFTSQGLPNRGSDPESALFLAPDGNFYGTTSQGGAGEWGTVFRMTPEGALSTLAEFSFSNASPNQPIASFVLGPDGSFYGGTRVGGPRGGGTIHRLRFDPTPALQSITSDAGGPRLRWRGAKPGTTYRVEAKDALSAPWQRLPGVVAADGAGLIDFQDSAGALVTSRFYRLVYQP